VFLSCCNVFLKCSLHLYHTNQFVVMMMMMMFKKDHGLKWGQIKTDMRTVRASVADLIFSVLFCNYC